MKELAGPNKQPKTYLSLFHELKIVINDHREILNGNQTSNRKVVSLPELGQKQLNINSKIRIT